MDDNTANDFYTSFSDMIETLDEDPETAVNVDWDDLDTDSWVRCPECNNTDVAMHIEFPDGTPTFTCRSESCLAHSSALASATADQILADDLDEPDEE